MSPKRVSSCEKQHNDRQRHAAATIYLLLYQRQAATSDNKPEKKANTRKQQQKKKKRKKRTRHGGQEAAVRGAQQTHAIDARPVHLSFVACHTAAKRTHHRKETYKDAHKTLSDVGIYSKNILSTQLLSCFASDS